MYNEQIEKLINIALSDGTITEKEKQILYRKAQAAGIDLDEFEMVLDARLLEVQKARKEQAHKTNPESNKLGDVRKCPHCGAVIGSFQMLCPDCGYEFSNVGPNKYVKKLSEDLEALSRQTNHRSNPLIELLDPMGIHDAQAKVKALARLEARFIANYPLPMTKEDCIETLNFILPKLAFIGSNAATFSWKNKYDAIIKKMELEAIGNAKMQEIVKCYKEQGKISGFATFAIWFKSLSDGAKVGIIFGIFYLIVFIVTGVLLAQEY